jgi:hypothetical protein
VQAEGVARLVAASRANPALDGLAVNGWHSHPAIGSMGVTRVDRRLAIDPAPVRAAQAPAALALLGVAPAPAVRAVQRVRLVLVDDAGAWDGDVRVRVRVVQGGAVLWEGEAEAAGGGREAAPGRRVREIASLSFPAPAAGRLRLEAAVGELRAGVDVLGVEAAPPPGGPPLAVADGAGVVAGRLAAHGVPVRSWRTGDGGPVLVADATTRVVHLLLAGPPRRSAYLVRPRPTVGGAVNLGDLRRLGLAGPDAAVRRVTGDWLGSWAFSRGADLLPALGPAGVWDWTRCEIVPELMLCGIAGEVLAGACSFPDGGIFSVGDPVVGGTVVLCRRGGHELLLVTLPLWEDSALARALLLDVAAWLRGASSRRAP